MSSCYNQTNQICQFWKLPALKRKFQLFLQVTLRSPPLVRLIAVSSVLAFSGWLACWLGSICWWLLSEPWSASFRKRMSMFIKPLASKLSLAVRICAPFPGPNEPMKLNSCAWFTRLCTALRWRADFIIRRVLSWEEACNRKLQPLSVQLNGNWPKMRHFVQIGFCWKSLLYPLRIVSNFPLSYALAFKAVSQVWKIKREYN